MDVDPACRHVFVEQTSLLSWSDDAECEADIVIEVLPEVFFLGDGKLGSRKEWQPSDGFVASLPALPQPFREGPARPRKIPESRLDPELLREHPWLLDVVSTSRLKTGVAYAGAHDAGDHGDGAGSEADEDDFSDEGSEGDDRAA